MGEQKHIIKRQVMELKVQGFAKAQPLQAELSRIYRQRIVPLIERYCDELSAPDRLHRIDRLELDLGPVDSNQLEADLVAKVDAVLRQRLAERIGGQESAAVPPDKTPKTISQLELFSLFARQGSLPWWADLTQPRLLEDSLDYLLQHAPDRLHRLLRELAGEENPLQRLIQHYDDRYLTALATLLAPALAAFLAPLPRILAAACQRAEELSRLPPSGPEIFPEGEAGAFTGHAKQNLFNQSFDSRTGLQGQLRRHVWRSILQVAALSEEPYRGPIPFCRAVLPQLAGVLRLPYTALLTGLRQVLSTAATGVNSRFNWSSLEEAEPAQRKPGSPDHEQNWRSLDSDRTKTRRLGTGRAQQRLPELGHRRAMLDMLLGTGHAQPAKSALPKEIFGQTLDRAELTERKPGSLDHEQNLHSRRSLEQAERAQRKPGSLDHESGLAHSRRSLEQAEPAQRKPGSPGHEPRLAHSNRQESRLSQVDSDANEGAGRHHDGSVPKVLLTGLTKIPFS
ncbi:MAG: contractile injection system tape measure protein [Candidatus Competibacteraceae bacterium]